MSVTGSYWNRIRWRCSTGGKLTKITPFFASWRREEDGWEVGVSQTQRSFTTKHTVQFPSWPAFRGLQHRICSPPSVSLLPHSPWMTRTLIVWSLGEAAATNSQHCWSLNRGMFLTILLPFDVQLNIKKRLNPKAQQDKTLKPPSFSTPCPICAHTIVHIHVCNSTSPPWHTNLVDSYSTWVHLMYD